MSFTLVDYFEAFHELQRKKNFSANAIATYYTILAVFDKTGYPEQVKLPLRDLQKLAGLKSVATAHECKNVLKNYNLIDFKTKNGTIVYKLRAEHIPNTRRTKNECRANSDGLLSAPTRGKKAAERKEKESFPRTPFKEKEKSLLNQSSSSSISTERLERVETRERAAERKPATTVAHAKPLASPECDPNDIHDIWRETFGNCLRGDRAIELERLAGKDFGKARLAIEKTAKREGLHDTFAYFKTVFNGTAPLKGDDMRERTTQHQYKHPIRTGNEPWAKYSAGL